MTDNYRSEIFSRIRKLNFTNATIVGQMFRLFLLFLTFFSLFFCIGYVTKVGDSAQKTVCDLFCIGFKNSKILALAQNMFPLPYPDKILHIQKAEPVLFSFANQNTRGVSHSQCGSKSTR